MGETERLLGLASGDRNWTLSVLTTCWRALGHLWYLSEPVFLHPWNDITWNGYLLQIMAALKFYDLSLLAKISESRCVGCFLDKWVIGSATGFLARPHSHRFGKGFENPLAQSLPRFQGRSGFRKTLVMSLLLEYLQGMRNYYLEQFYLGEESSPGCEAQRWWPWNPNF